MMIFPKNGKVRIEQLRDEINALAKTINFEFPQMAIQWNKVDAVIVEDINGNATRYQAQIQAVIDAHAPTMVYFQYEIQEQRDKDTEAGYATLPDWARTMTADGAEAYITGEIFQGLTQAEVEAWIDANITGTNVTQLRTQTRAALKQLAAATITTRTYFVVIIKLLIYIRDLVIRFKQVQAAMMSKIQK